MNERAQLRIQEKSPLANLEAYRPTEFQTDITGINFETWAQNGVKTWLFDAEGTFVETDGLDPDPAVLAHIREAREAGHIDNIGIVTNKRPKNKADYIKIAWWARELGADIVLTPLSRADRKPGSRMILKAMAHFGVTPEQTAMVGDKLTGDIIAANRAGIRSIHVERLGEEDLPGDKYLRRPAEKKLKQKFEKSGARDITDHPESAAATTLGEYLESGKEIETIDFTTDSGWYARNNAIGPESHGVAEEDLDPDIKVLMYSDKIVGYGTREDIVLPAEVEAQIPPPWHDPVTKWPKQVPGEIREILDTLDPKIREEYSAFMEKHGHQVANGLSWSRIGVLPLIAYCYKTGHKKLAFALQAWIPISDALDGPAARSSLKGGSKEGGKLDQRIDKISAGAIHAMHYMIGRTREEILVGRLARELWVTANRERRHKQNIDTSAVYSGKISTSGESTSILLTAAEIAASKNSPAARYAQQAASLGLKWWSARHSDKEWLRLDAKKKHEAERMPEIVKILREEAGIDDSI